MYRPQFAYPLSPEPCEDQRCTYSFDSTNTPGLSGTLAAAAQTGRIPLSLDLDADFYLRGISTQGPVSFRLTDPETNPLSDGENAAQSTNFELPTEYSNTNGAGIVALESGAGGVFAHGSANFLLYLYNPTASGIDLTTCVVNLHGIKVYRQRCE